jgi:aspartyl-tRNA(Asn)/glutamyl-tRNA(Gln) amidotransferase subunit C
MPEEISPELFNHLVELAALELAPDEAEYLRRELNNQLASIHTLAAIPLPDNIEPAARGVPYPVETSAPPREDIHIPWQNVAAMLAQAPQVDDGYIIVPEIPHEELE